VIVMFVLIIASDKLSCLTLRRTECSSDEIDRMIRWIPDIIPDAIIYTGNKGVLLRSQLNARFLDFLASYLTDRGSFPLF
jgi:hypothetical protein